MKILLVAITLFAIYHTQVLCNNYGTEIIEVTYHVWVDDEITSTRQIKVQVPKESKFYDVMVKAGKMKKAFEFDSTVHPLYGHFITKIGSDSQDPSIKKYWRFFILDEAPKKNNPPGQKDLSPLGVSSLVVQDGKHYLWWLRAGKLPHKDE